MVIETMTAHHIRRLALTLTWQSYHSALTWHSRSAHVARQRMYTTALLPPRHTDGTPATQYIV